MSCENTSRSMRYYTIEYNRVLHRMIYAANTAPFSESIGQSLIVRMIPLCRAAIAMARNVRRYVSDMPVRRVSSEISELSAAAVTAMQEASGTASTVVNTDEQRLHFEKSVLCINNSMFSDMSEHTFDSSIESRYIREMIPFCSGIAETAALARRFPVCDELRTAMSELTVGMCEIIADIETIRMDSV